MTKSSEILKDGKLVLKDVQQVHMIKRRNAENQNNEYESKTDFGKHDYKEALPGKHTFKIFTF